MRTGAGGRRGGAGSRWCGPRGAGRGARRLVPGMGKPGMEVPGEQAENQNRWRFVYAAQRT